MNDGVSMPLQFLKRSYGSYQFFSVVRGQETELSVYDFGCAFQSINPACHVIGYFNIQPERRTKSGIKEILGLVI